MHGQHYCMRLALKGTEPKTCKACQLCPCKKTDTQGLDHPVTHNCIPGAEQIKKVDGYTLALMKVQKMEFPDSSVSVDWYSQICERVGMQPIGCHGSSYHYVNGLVSVNRPSKPPFVVLRT
jgi:hypothetical protein